MAVDTYPWDATWGVPYRGFEDSRTAVVKPDAFRTVYVSRPHVVFFLYFCCGATKIKIQPRR